MSDADPSDGREAFLSRWSRLKRTAESSEALPAVNSPGAAQPEAKANEPIAQPQVLPPIESITLETDIAGFLHPQVDPAVRRSALKKLFQDPHFNVMDGLDTYIGDYNTPDPLPDSMLKELQFAKDYIFKDPTKSKQPANEEPLAEQDAALEAPDTIESLNQPVISTVDCEEMSQLERIATEPSSKT
jgi:hypothetical protein